MDKICYLAKRVDTAINNSSFTLNNDLFGSPDNNLITACKEELDEVFGGMDTLFITERKIYTFQSYCYDSNITYSSIQ